MQQRKIDLFIIGAPKSATTSLKNYLSSHQDIAVSEEKELTFFVNDDEYVKGEEELWGDYYASQNLSGKVLVAKNVSVMYSEKALLRIKEHNSKIKLVMILRNPVDRAYSAYWYARRKGWENLETFEEAAFADPLRFGGDWIREGGCAYLEHGCYAKYVDLVERIFGKDSLRVYFLEDLKKRPQEICNELFDWVGVERKSISFVRERFNKAATVRSRAVVSLLRLKPGLVRTVVTTLIPRRVRNKLKAFIAKLNEKPFEVPKLDQKTRSALIDYFEPHNEKLKDRLQVDLPWK